MSDVERAINYLTNPVNRLDLYGENGERTEVFDTAIAALREKQEREGCIYCVGFGVNSATVKNAYGFSEEMKQINFCPHCGRKLTGGAE